MLKKKHLITANFQNKAHFVVSIFYIGVCIFLEYLRRSCDIEALLVEPFYQRRHHGMHERSDPKFNSFFLEQSYGIHILGSKNRM